MIIELDSAAWVAGHFRGPNKRCGFNRMPDEYSIFRIHGWNRIIQNTPHISYNLSLNEAFISIQTVK